MCRTNIVFARAQVNTVKLPENDKDDDDEDDDNFQCCSESRIASVMGFIRSQFITCMHSVSKGTYVFFIIFFAQVYYKYICAAIDLHSTSEHGTHCYHAFDS